MLNTIFANFWGVHFLLRFLHLFFAVVWIGLLYYFNFVQGAFMAETTDPTAKAQVLQKLLPRALWWFRWGAMWTFVTGVIMISWRMHIEVRASGPAVLGTSFWLNILTGAFLATLMFVNVWLIIWPKQKVVIANALAGGPTSDPEAIAAAARSTVASRTNTLFSIPMMFMMIGANHLGYTTSDSSQIGLYWLIAALIILAIEFNAIKGKTGPMTSVKGVIGCGFGLLLVLAILLTVLM